MEAGDIATVAFEVKSTPEVGFDDYLQSQLA